MSNFNLGTIELYLGLEATGFEVTVDTATPLPIGETTIPVIGAELTDIGKNDKMKLLKVGTTNEYILVISEAAGDLTVRRDWFRNGGEAVIADATVLTEYTFVKRKIAEDGVEVNGEALVNPVRVISHDGVEEILFDTESEELKLTMTLLDKSDWNWLKEQCPIVFEADDTDPDNKFVYMKSVDDYDVTEHVIPAMIAFKALSYNSYAKIFPELTLLSIPTESYSKGEVFKMQIEMSALKVSTVVGSTTILTPGWDVTAKP